MSDHTPGPWKAEVGGGRGSWIKGTNGEWAALACGDTNERAEANARVITAAPTAIEALREIAEQDVIELVLDPEWPQRIARAALATIEGNGYE